MIENSFAVSKELNKKNPPNVQIDKTLSLFLTFKRGGDKNFYSFIYFFHNIPRCVRFQHLD